MHRSGVGLPFIRGMFLTGSLCQQCGAVGEDGTQTCADRFAALLALDHSRREPWGSRHGLAFAAYTLQHSVGQSPEALARCWVMLCRVYVFGDDRMRVARALRASGGRGLARWDVSPFPRRDTPPDHFETTIADLGEFDANHYATRLDAWCRATLASWCAGAIAKPALRRKA